MSFCNKSSGQRLSLSANVTFVGFHVKCYKCIDLSALKVRKVPSLHLTLTACILRQIYIDCPLGAKTRNYSVTIIGFLPAKNMYLMLSVVIYDRCLKKKMLFSLQIFFVLEIEEYHKVHFSFLHFFCSDGRQTGDASVWSTKTEHLGASRFSSDGLQKTCCHCTCNLLQHKLLFLLIKKNNQR